jgi:uncharacterized protein YbjQ (UPF0145 family)
MEDEDHIGKALGFVDAEEVETEEVQPERIKVEPTPQVRTTVTSEPAEIKSYVQQDYEEARRRMTEILDIGTAFARNSAAIANARNDPESIQAAAGAIKAVTDAADKFVKLSETHQKVTGTNVHGDVKTVTNNLFVGSTSDLNKMLKEAKKKNNLKQIDYGGHND